MQQKPTSHYLLLLVQLNNLLIFLCNSWQLLLSVESTIVNTLYQHQASKLNPNTYLKHMQIESTRIATSQAGCIMHIIPTRNVIDITLT